MQRLSPTEFLATVVQDVLTLDDQTREALLKAAQAPSKSRSSALRAAFEKKPE